MSAPLAGAVGILIGLAALGLVDDAKREARLERYFAWTNTAEHKEIIDCSTRALIASMFNEEVRWCDDERLDELYALRRERTAVSTWDILRHLLS